MTQASSPSTRSVSVPRRVDRHRQRLRNLESRYGPADACIISTEITQLLERVSVRRRSRRASDIWNTQSVTAHQRKLAALRQATSTRDQSAEAVTAADAASLGTAG